MLKSTETRTTMKSILIAGPTASGKSGFALELAKKINGIIINTDALQVYDQWKILTARPDDQDMQGIPHALYGHVKMDRAYSVGEWIKDVKQILQHTDLTPIFTGGTGLYFGALTNGLADIPAIPATIRIQGNQIRSTQGKDGFAEILQKHDPETYLRIDQNNPARLQRAWEVWQTTGKGLEYWKSTTPAPLIPLEDTRAMVLNWPVNLLNERIDQRFDQMMDAGAIHEVEGVKTHYWHPALPSSRALGAAEIIDAINSKITMQDAVIKSKTLTRQFAKRQRTWFRSKMSNWQQIDMCDHVLLQKIIENIDT